MVANYTPKCRYQAVTAYMASPLALTMQYRILLTNSMTCICETRLGGFLLLASRIILCYGMDNTRICQFYSVGGEEERDDGREGRGERGMEGGREVERKRQRVIYIDINIEYILYMITLYYYVCVFIRIKRVI